MSLTHTSVFADSHIHTHTHIVTQRERERERERVTHTHTQRGVTHRVTHTHTQSDTSAYTPFYKDFHMTEPSLALHSLTCLWVSL